MLEDEAAPPPGPSRRPLLWAALAIVAAVALVAGLVAVVDGDSGEPATDGGVTSSSPSSSTAAAGAPSSTSPGGSAGEGAAEVEAAVAELSAFVEQARGLRFRQPVEVQLLDGDAFIDRLLADFEEERADLDDTERYLKAVHLLPDDSNLFEDLRALYVAGVLGFYDPETGELVVRGSELSPYVRSTLVHELVHALDDQHFELHRPELEDADDEREYAFSALYEGNARAVEEMWVKSLPAEERAQAEQEERQAGAALSGVDLPEYLLAVLAFPYVFGEQLVERLRATGGERRVDEAFRNPPTTTEHVLRPDKYLAGEPAVAVERPQADGPVIDEGTVGEWDLYLLLAGQLGEQRAITAADGWGGDRFVAWEDGDRACLRATFVMDTVGDLGEVAEALEAWAEEHGDASLVGGDDRVTLTACG